MANNTVQVVAFIFFVAEVVGIPLSIRHVIKFATRLFKTKGIGNIILANTVVVGYVAIGVVIPLFIIIGLWSSPFSWLWISLQILAWYLLLSFAGLVWMVLYTLRIIKESEQKEKNKKEKS